MQADVRRVHTTYAVRLRSDFYLTNDNLLPFYQEWCQILNRYDVGYQIFRNRVLTSNYYTRDPRNDNGGYVYQFSDCFQFGRTEDLLKLWDGHQESFASLNYFKSHPRSKYYNPKGFNHRYTAEQYFFLNVIRKAGLQVQIPEYYMDTSSERFVFESEKLFASNVIVGNYLQLGLQSKFRDLNPDDLRFYSLSRIAEEYLYNVDPTNEKCLRYQKQLDIEFVKYDPNRYKERFTLLSHWQWKALYQHYCLSVVSPLWIMYRVLSGMRLGVSALRRILIRVLDRLGMKEFIKRLLSGRLRL